MSNVVILAGVLCVLAAVMALAGPWWAVLGLGVTLLVAGWRQWATDGDEGEG